jgi:hypothetical protein
LEPFHPFTTAPLCWTHTAPVVPKLLGQLVNTVDPAVQPAGLPLVLVEDEVVEDELVEEEVVDVEDVLVVDVEDVLVDEVDVEEVVDVEDVLDVEPPPPRLPELEPWVLPPAPPSPSGRTGASPTAQAPWAQITAAVETSSTQTRVVADASTRMRASPCGRRRSGRTGIG